jgi:hypothetical protein
MYAFAFRFAVVLALALIVLLVTTWARPRIPSNACRKQPHFVLSPRPMCIPTHWMSYWERRGPRGLCSFSLWGPHLFCPSVAQTSQPSAAHPARIIEHHLYPNLVEPRTQMGHLVRGSFRLMAAQT